MGLMLNVGDKDDCVAFMGYRELPDGSKCYAETNHLIKRLGDIIIAVNGRSCVGKTFKEVIVSFLLVVLCSYDVQELTLIAPLLQPYLKECKTFAYIRFVHESCGVDRGLTTSCGSLGRFVYKDLSSKYKPDRRRLLAKRLVALLQAEEEKDEGSRADTESASDDSDDSDSDESASGIEPDSEDEALLQENESDSDSQGDAGEAPTSGGALSSGGNGKDIKTQAEKELSDLIDAQVSKQESTRHLAYGLLGLDVGYSSDEGGDEDVAFYVSDIARYIMA